MRILSQKRENNRVTLEVEEAYSRFQESFEKALVEAGKEIKLPGFRPGKAPRDMIERALNREYVEHRAAQELIAGIYPQLIEEAKIDPVDYPNVEITQQEKEKTFLFKIAVDVYPTVKLGKYKGLKVSKKPTAVTEEEVLKILGNLQERFTVPDKDGKPELLPLDDEFAKKVSRFGTLAELKEEVREALLSEKKAESEADVKNKLVAAASGEAKVDIPPSMVEREVDIMLDELKTSLAQSNLTLEDYLRGSKKEEKELREEMKRSSEIRVKGKIILKAVAEEEKIAVTPEDLQSELKNLAGSSGAKAEDFEKSLGENGKKYIQEYLLRSKALDFLAGKANIKEEEVKQ
jgi:FKBP-type peptidyl-prolyl cis-trans isomerase (trigger factor)